MIISLFKIYWRAYIDFEQIYLKHMDHFCEYSQTSFYVRSSTLIYSFRDTLSDLPGPSTLLSKLPQELSYTLDPAYLGSHNLLCSTPRSL